MASVFKKTVTLPIPACAELVTLKGIPSARWKSANGKLRVATVVNNRIRYRTDTYFAKFRDAEGRLVERSTGCRDKGAALAALHELTRREERVRSGVMTTAEARLADRAQDAIAVHLDDYVAALEARGSSPKHVRETRRVLNRVFEACGVARLADLDRSTLERHLNTRRQAGTSARTRNIDLTHAIAFGNWCVPARLAANPFAKLSKANEAADRRRTRRALSEAEVDRFLLAARERPLSEARAIRRGPRKGTFVADVRPEVVDRLELLGRERALIYLVLVTTGLRRGELASLTVGSLRLDPPASLELAAASAKNRTASTTPLRDDVAALLKDWLADKLARTRREALKRGDPVPAALPLDTPVFRVPVELVKILDRDLRLAGIPKRDDRGQVVDVHALRKTFGTHLARAGVSLRVAQELMRHSDPKLTANLYTDPRLLDAGGAVDLLPAYGRDKGDKASKSGS